MDNWHVLFVFDYIVLVGMPFKLTNDGFLQDLRLHRSSAV